jgi:ferredoxin--NADP+ reductase
VAVIGAGNVALDVARFLAGSHTELGHTDVPDAVLAAVGRSRVEEIHVIARRSPAQARFTPKELRELGQMADADVFVDGSELVLDDAGAAAVAAEPVVRRNLAVLREWTDRPPSGRPRRIFLRFLLRPVQVLGEAAVEGLRLERTRLDGTGAAVGTAEMQNLEAQLVVRCVGYRGTPVPGLPFDEHSGVIPNDGGRVLRDGVASPGEYVTGWAKRGPTGVIGTNRHDAADTVAALLSDARMHDSRRAPMPQPDAILERLQHGGVRVVRWDGWSSIDDAEISLGKSQGRDRVKIADLAELLRLAAERDGVA